MVDTIEVKDWTTLSHAFLVQVKSLADLERIAEKLGMPFIIKKGKEYLVFSGHMGPAPLAYWFKQ